MGRGRSLVRHHRRGMPLSVLGLALVVAGAGLLVTGPGAAVAGPNVTLGDWRVEPSTVKENQPWTVKLWVANLGNEAVKKPFSVEVRECDKEMTKCDKVWASTVVKPEGDDLKPGKLPGKLIIIEIKQGLGKGDHYLQLVVDAKKEVQERPYTRRITVPVGFWKQ